VTGEGTPTAIVCDDAPGFRALMSALLADAGLEVVGEADTWAEAERLAPGVDAILIDLWMPEIDIDALARVRASAPAAMLAVVTALAPAEATERIAAVEVDLLLQKSAPPTEIAAAIAMRVLGGETAAPL
jgi:DNA-binding NarL/FixJ family response regulator